MIEFGYSMDNRTLPEFLSPDRYIDLVQVASRPGSIYTDFEGFTDKATIDAVLNNRRIAEHIAETCDTDWMRALVAHYVHQSIEVGYAPTSGDIINFIDIISWLFQSRYWMKPEARS